MTYSAAPQEPQRIPSAWKPPMALGKKPPVRCSRKGTIGKVLESRKPWRFRIWFWNRSTKNSRRNETDGEARSSSALRPLVADDESLGVININPLHGTKVDFEEDFLFLSTSPPFSPGCQNTEQGAELSRNIQSKRQRLTSGDFLKERLGEV